MEKYLYLTEVSWATTWINGGSVPIFLASKYLKDKRDGVFTPDETLVHDSSIDLKSLSPAIHIEQTKNISIVNCRYNGQKIPNVRNASYYREDGLILSFCNSFSENIARRLGKKVCVKILDMDRLRREFDLQLGCIGIMKECCYTDGHRRDHFLKSVEDSWQEEFRIFWKITVSKWVTVPDGIAEFVTEFT